MMEQQVIPNGYKRTELGVIPSQWDIITLGDISVISRLAGAEYTSFWKEVPNGEIIALRGFNIGKNEIIPKKLTRISNSLSLKLKRSRLAKGDIIYPCVGSVGNATVIGEDNKYHIQQNIARITPSNSKVFPYYLSHYLMSFFGLSEIDRFVATTSQPSVLVSSLRQYRIILPSIEEQTAIANALSDVDSLITSIEKLIAKKQAVKTATMQQLLTGKKRLPPFDTYQEGECKDQTKGIQQTELGEIPEDWELKSIAEITSNIIDYRGRTPKKIGMDWGGGDIVALSAGNVKKGYIDLNAESYLASEELFKKWMKTGIPKKNDIAFTMEAPLGNVALIPDDNKYILSQRTILMQFDDSWISSHYLFQVFMSDEFQEYLSDRATGSTAQGIKRSTFELVPLCIPSLDEQKAIALVLTTMDEDLDCLNKRLDKTQQIKQGMMQQLLTGKTRLI